MKRDGTFCCMERIRATGKYEATALRGAIPPEKRHVIVDTVGSGRFGIGLGTAIKSHRGNENKANSLFA